MAGDRQFEVVVQLPEGAPPAPPVPFFGGPQQQPKEH
jgi:hypothetical protein